MGETKLRRITSEDLYLFKSVGTPRTSPDGKNVIYSVQWVEKEKEKKYSNLWVVPTCCGEPSQFTYGKQSDTAPQWSPDGTQIAFLSNREDSELPSQIYVISYHGGEARKVSDIKGMIQSFEWSPDGNTFLCVINKVDPDSLERMLDEKKKALGVVYRQYDRVRFKADGIGYLPKEIPHLWTIDADSGQANQLTDNAVFSENGAVWSPDGSSIAFLSNRSERPDFAPWSDDIYIYSIADNTMRKIETPIGGKSKLRFSPNGKMLAYVGVEGTVTWYGYERLWVVPIDNSEEARCLTVDAEFQCSSGTLNDTGSAEFMAPIWSSDSRALTFQADLHGSSMLMQMSLDGDRLSEVIGEGGVVGSPDFCMDESVFSCTFGSIDQLPEVFVFNTGTGEEKQLSFHNTELRKELDLGSTEEVWYEGPDGNALQGWILYPPEFDNKKQYASILEIHGGPGAQYGNGFMHEFYTLAAQDYIVYYTNPRGGTGYGETHCQAILGAWGDRDYADLMEWTGIISKRPYIDSQRMGVTGGSYGGYMTVWIIGHTEQFKAAVTQRCVSNLTSMWGSSDMNWATQEIFGAENTKPPYLDFERYWKLSPIAYIGNAKTPTMVIHSESDFRCPIEQGEQVFVSLSQLKVPTEMVRFPDEPHGLSRIGRTDRRIVRLEKMAEWFDKYL